MKRKENQTVIRFNDEEDEMDITTSQKSERTRIKKLRVEPYRKRNDSWRYSLPKTCLRIGPPKKASENQRNAARKNILKAHISRETINRTEGNKKNPQNE